MSYTSSEVKQAWKERNYKRFEVNLRYDTDADLIQFIEDRKADVGTTELFRAGIQRLMESGEYK